MCTLTDSLLLNNWIHSNMFPTVHYCTHITEMKGMSTRLPNILMLQDKTNEVVKNSVLIHQ